MALGEATRLAWKWNVTQIPSTLPENVAADHDYLSIAVKFDNGQDLTYLWSASLEPGTGFRCPLPGWDTRETHVVLRSGRKNLGQWLLEDRNIQADYAGYVGGTLPTRITHVWLIANTIFHQGAGDARFGDINLGASGKGSWTGVL